MCCTELSLSLFSPSVCNSSSFLTSLTSYYVECPSVWVCLMFLHDSIQIMHFCQEYHWSNVEFFALYPIRWGVILYPITGYVNFNHFSKVVSYFLPVSLFFPLLLISIFWGEGEEIWDYVHILLLIKFSMRCLYRYIQGISIYSLSYLLLSLLT